MLVSEIYWGQNQVYFFFTCWACRVGHFKDPSRVAVNPRAMGGGPRECTVAVGAHRCNWARGQPRFPALFNLIRASNGRLRATG
jgi:hypothetical protein